MQNVELVQYMNSKCLFSEVRGKAVGFCGEQIAVFKGYNLNLQRNVKI